MIAISLAAALHCTAVAGAAPLLEPRTLLLIGEMHGTREIPPVVAELACLARRRRVPVVVALELHVEEAARLDAWMAGAAPTAELLRGEFWTRTYQDGRTSAAMAAMLARLRALGVRVVLIDPHPPGGKDRDEKMADGLAALRAQDPGSLILALVGNLHNRIALGSPWDPGYRPMGWFLRERKIALRSLEVTYASGNAWTCGTSLDSSCGIHALRGEERGAAPVVRLEGAPAWVDGTLYVGALSASPPAVRQ